MFKKFLMFLGAIFLMIIIAGVLAYTYFAIAGRALDKESAAYVDQAVPAIFQNWDQAELIKRSHPSLKAKVPDEQVEKLFATLKTIGDMKRTDGCKGQSVINYVPKQGFVTTATYQCQADFEKDTATITLSLVKDGDWQIAGMNVNSPFFQGKN